MFDLFQNKEEHIIALDSKNFVFEHIIQHIKKKRTEKRNELGLPDVRGLSDCINPMIERTKIEGIYGVKNRPDNAKVMQDFITGLHKSGKIKLAIASFGNKSVIKLVLRRLGILDCFMEIYTPRDYNLPDGLADLGNKNKMLEDLAKTARIDTNDRDHVHFYDDTGRNIEAYYGGLRTDNPNFISQGKGFNHTHAEKLVEKLNFVSVAEVLREGKKYRLD